MSAVPQETDVVPHDVRPVHKIRPVCDPEMPQSFRRWAIRQRPVFDSRGELAAVIPGGSSRGIRPAAIFCWLLFIAFLILFFTSARSSISLDWVIPAVPAVVFAVAIQRRASRSDLTLCRGHVIFLDSLDDTCRLLLGRARSAIGSIQHSEVRAAGLLDRPVHDELLSRHEWEIASKLREITEFRTLHKVTTPGMAGPMTSDVLAAHQRAIELAQEAITARIEALEHYARQIIAADEADRDWQQAVALSKLNDRYLDLVASTTQDEHATSEIVELTERLATAASARNERLHDTDLAAEILILPESTGQRPRGDVLLSGNS